MCPKDEIKEINENDIKKIKLWNTGYFSNKFPICDEEWAISQERYVLGLCNHYIQTPDVDDILMKDNNITEHKNQYIKLITNDTIKSKIKLVYSAYSIMKNGGSGYPDGKSDCKKCITQQCKKECTKSVPYQKAYKPL